jgi:DNA-binding response OmpR family regulator
VKQPASSNSSPFRRIIIVEYDAELRSSLVRFLGINGYEVVAASSALEFYRMIDHASFSLAIMGVGIPDQSSLVLVEYLRKNTVMHIIMLITNNTIEDRLSCYQAGADMLLEKPVDFRELSALLSNVFFRIENRSVSEEFTQSLSLYLPHKERKKVIDDTLAWKILSDGWRLLSPGGDSIELTLKEFRFLTALCCSTSTAVPRRELLETLEYRNDEYGNRALESLVHRLRSKTATLGTSPIKTAHGVGYSFAAPVNIV